ncbi:MAG TPA: ERF family protein, partial [Gaiellaceae bacterium]
MRKTATKEQQPDLLAGSVKEAPPPKLPAAKPEKTAKPKRGAASTAVALHKPQPPDQPRSVLELCMMAARDPSIPTDRVKAFLEMADAQERKEAETLFDHAMLAAQAEMPQIPRGSYNTHTKSWWAKLENISAKIDPIAREHGFTLSYGVGEQRIEDHYHQYVDVTWNGVLASGKKASFTKRYDADIGRDDKGPKGEGTKSLAQGAGSSITYGRRFLKCMVFDVQILGADKDGNPIGAEPEAGAITEKQAEELLSLCSDKGIDLATFQKAFRVPKIEVLPAVRFEDVKARLKSAPKAEQTSRT